MKATTRTGVGTSQQWVADIGGRLLRHLITGRFDIVFKAVCVVSERPPDHDVSALFHYLVQGCASSKQPVAAAWCVSAMKEFGLLPDRFLFNLAMDTSAKAGNLDSATQLWQEMAANGIPPNAVSYNTMINACAQARDGLQAESWIDRMTCAGFAPCVVSYSSVIAAFAKAGKCSKALEWYEKASAAGIVADVIIFNSLINACAQGGRPQLARVWLAKMLDSGLEPDKTTYNSLIHASAKIGDLETAEYWITEMGSTNKSPDVVTFGSLLHACARACNVDRAEYWMEFMISLRLKPNVVCFNSMLHACAQRGDCASALKWFQRMSSEGVRPGRISYNSIIGAFSRAGELDSAEVWLNRLVKAGFHVDPPCFVLLSGGLMQLAAGNASRSHLQAHSLIIKAYARARKLVLIRQHIAERIASVCKAKQIGIVYHEELKEICLWSGGVRFASAVFQLLGVPLEACPISVHGPGDSRPLAGQLLPLPDSSLYCPTQPEVFDESTLSPSVRRRSFNSGQLMGRTYETSGSVTMGSDPYFEETSAPAEESTVASASHHVVHNVANVMGGFKILTTFGGDCDTAFYNSAACFDL